MSRGHPRSVAALAAALALAFVAGACASGSRSAQETRAPTGPRVSTAPSVAQTPNQGDGDDLAGPTPEPATVPAILDFEAPLVGGGTLDGAELAGAPVAVWFWAPW
jgi:hypothetical protein